MSKRHKAAEGHRSGQERWLVTYSDLITLLMIFFIVMYSMSKVDAEKFRAVAESLNISLGGGTPSRIDMMNSPSGPSIINSGVPQQSSKIPGSNSEPPVQQESNYPVQNTTDNGEGNDSGKSNLEKLTIEGIKAKLDQFAKENDIQTRLVSSIEERGLVVSIQDTLLFEKGSADVTTGSHLILKKIAAVLVAAPNYIKVEGHTCNLPIHTVQFPSNWELSVLRSTNVVQILIQEGGIPPARLSAAGYGEYRPIADNNTEIGRIKNRRVDLVILRSKYDFVEPGKPST